MKGLGTYSMSWPELESERTAAFSSMLTKRELTDVTIACEDDQIQAHKVILSAASLMFQNVLNKNPHNHPLLYFHGIKKKQMEIVLDFIYSGEAKVPMDGLDDFLKIAKNLQVKGLVDINNMDYTSKTPVDDTIDDYEESLMQRSTAIENLEENEKEIDYKYKKECPVDDASYALEENEEITEDFSADNTFVEKSSFGVKFKPEENKKLEERIKFLLIKTESGIWECKQCNFSAKGKSHVKEHIETHIEGFKQTCNLCSRIFKNRATLRSHLKKCSMKIAYLTV